MENKHPTQSPSLTPDEILIQTVLDGDVEAFSALVHRHQARVRLLCLIRLGQAEDADDAAQAAFLKGFQNLSRFKKNSSFLTWLLHIAENECIDMLRSKGRRPTESLESLREGAGDAFEHLLRDPQSEAASKTYESDELRLLARLFAALPEADRELLALREIQDMAYEEMAQRLHCSLDAVKGRLKRARQALLEKVRSTERMGA